MTLIMLCAAALVGLLAGDLALLDRASLLEGAAAGLIGALLCTKNSLVRLLALAAVAASLGALRAQAAVNTDPLASFAGVSAEVHGQIAAAPTRTDRSLRLLLDVDTVASEPVADARLLVITDPDGPANAARPPGDRLTLSGRIAAPTAPRQQHEMVFPRIIRFDPVDADLLHQPLLFFARLRTSIAASVQRWVPEPQASLASGVLLGGSGLLDADFKLSLQRSGLAHLLAIDGYKQVIRFKPTDVVEIKDGVVQFQIPVPGAKQLVKDTIRIESKLLKEKQVIHLVF